MNTFHIEDFKCVFCKNWFNPPTCLPYLLDCSHNICTLCLNKASLTRHQDLVCPEDLELNPVGNIHLNRATKRALERLLKEHRTYADNSQLLTIQVLTKYFEDSLAQQQPHLQAFASLLQEVYLSEIARLQKLYDKVKTELNRPHRVTHDWKEMVKIYLSSLKGTARGTLNLDTSELNHYVEEGRKIKQELKEFSNIDFQGLTSRISEDTSICFKNSFSMFSMHSGKREHAVSTPLQNVSNVISSMQTASASRPSEQSKKYYRNEEQDELRNEFKNESKSKSMQINQFSNYRVDECHTFGSGEEQSPSRPTLPQYDKETSRRPNSKIVEGSFGKNQDKPVEMRNQHKSLIGKTLIPSEQSLERQIEKNHMKGLQELMRGEQSKADKRAKEKERIVLKPRSSLLAPQMETAVTSVVHRSVQQSRLERNKTEQNKNDLLAYSPETERSPAQKDDDSDQMLLLSERDAPHWRLGNMNFLKEWNIPQASNESELMVKQRDYVNCERGRQGYMARMAQTKAEEALRATTVKDDFIELINYSLADVEMKLYLGGLDWEHVEVVKLVRTGLSDAQLNQLLNFLVHSRVTTLVLSGNVLNEMSLDALLHFLEANNALRNVYLSKNNINALKNHAKTKIGLLRDRGLNIYI